MLSKQMLFKGGSNLSKCYGLIDRFSEDRFLEDVDLIRLRFGSELSADYFFSLMNFCKGRVGRLRTGPDGAFTHMNTGILDKLAFPYLPMSKQRKYERILFEANDRKSKLLANYAKIDELFNTLCQHAFKGNLTQSKVA